MVFFSYFNDRILWHCVSWTLVWLGMLALCHVAYPNKFLFCIFDADKNFLIYYYSSQDVAVKVFTNQEYSVELLDDFRKEVGRCCNEQDVAFLAVTFLLFLKLENAW